MLFEGDFYIYRELISFFPEDRDFRGNTRKIGNGGSAGIF